MIVLQILIIIAVVVGLPVYALVRWMGQSSKQAGLKAAELINNAELHYDTTIEQRLQLATQNGEMLELEALVEELFVMIKPEIDSLLAHINATDANLEVTIPYTSRYFNNAVTLAEAYFAWRNKNKTQLLSDGNEEKMYRIVKDALRADIQRRLLQWNLERKKISE
jgi:hypothetical protein